MCKIESEANPTWAKQIGGGAPLFMSHQIHKLKLGRDRWEREHLHGGKDLFHMLRPEDAIHIPQLRLDCNSGKIIVEFNKFLIKTALLICEFFFIKISVVLIFVQISFNFFKLKFLS